MEKLNNEFRVADALYFPGDSSQFFGYYNQFIIWIFGSGMVCCFIVYPKNILYDRFKREEDVYQRESLMYEIDINTQQTQDIDPMLF